MGVAERPEPGLELRADALAGDVLTRARLYVPRAWHLTRVRSEWHDDRPVLVVRYQPEARTRLAGPHATVVLDRNDGTLLGWTRLDHPRTGGLPSPTEALSAASVFLDRVDPDHAAELTVQWVAQHDEPVVVSVTRVVTIAGMRVNSRHPDGRYTWVVVGPDLTVLTYERDVVWDAQAARRSTHMWVHDRWIEAQDGEAPPAPAPYAPVRRR